MHEEGAENQFSTGSYAVATTLKEGSKKERAQKPDMK